MKKNRFSEVGIKGKITLGWLNKTADLALAGYDKKTITQVLNEFLAEELSVGNNVRFGSRGKTISILEKTWVQGDNVSENLRKRGLVFYEKCPAKERIILHWGATMAAYPFLATVALHTGRLLKLQGTAGAKQVQRRIREQYGESENVSRATRHVLRNFIEWGVLLDSGNTGVYLPGGLHSIKKPELICWLIECLLSTTEASSMLYKAAIDSPALFPFKINLISANMLAKHGNIQVFKSGLEDEIITVKNQFAGN